MLLTLGATMQDSTPHGASHIAPIMAQPSKAMATGPETSQNTRMRTDKSGRIHLRIGSHLITRPVCATPPRCSAGRSLAPRSQYVLIGKHLGLDLRDAQLAGAFGLHWGPLGPVQGQNTAKLPMTARRSITQ